MYVGDYLADTIGLTLSQHGAYHLAIYAYWRRGGPLPDADARAIMGIEAEALARFFDRAKGDWRHKRVDAELTKATQLNLQRSEAGKISAAKRLYQRPFNDRSTTGVTKRQRNDAPSPSPSQETKNQEQKVESHDTAPASPSPNDLQKQPASTSAPKGNGHDRGSRGTRLATDWEPDIRDREFADGIGLNAAEIAAGFRDYWIACPGQRAIKLDWAATWRNWCRRQAAGGDRPGGHGSRRPGIVAAGRRAMARLAELDARDRELAGQGLSVDDDATTAASRPGSGPGDP